MDLITIAIVSAIKLCAKTVVEKSIQETYDRLKALIKSKFGKKFTILKKIEKHENAPDSKINQFHIEKDLRKFELENHSDIVNLAQILLSKIRENPDGNLILNQLSLDQGNSIDSVKQSTIANNRSVIVKGSIKGNIITGDSNK